MACLRFISNLNHEPVWKPHRRHFYQRMIQAGQSHAVVASYYGFWAVGCAGVGLFYLKGAGGYWIWFVSLLFMCVTWAVTLHLERQKNP